MHNNLKRHFRHRDTETQRHRDTEEFTEKVLFKAITNQEEYKKTLTIKLVESIKLINLCVSVTLWQMFFAGSSFQCGNWEVRYV